MRVWLRETMFGPRPRKGFGFRVNFLLLLEHRGDGEPKNEANTGVRVSQRFSDRASTEVGKPAKAISSDLGSFRLLSIRTLPKEDTSKL